ncbi:MAG TPA: hypothetical protein VGF55_09260 [Gemmataceae bacterium]|jgi:hypothetical protein
MSPAFALLLTFAVAQPDAGLAVCPTRGQELVYRGHFAEEARGGAPYRRDYDLECRTFVLDAGPAGAEVALLTILRTAGAAPDAAGSARLELATVDARGRVTLQSTAAPPRVPLDGPPSLEPAGFVELPPGPVAAGGEWDAADGPRPPRTWRVEEDGFFHGVRCLKLVGEQHSAEWERPTADGPAWRRTDVVWLAAASGTVQKLERTVERRAGGDGSAGLTDMTTYELDGGLTLPEQLAADRRREIQQAAQFQQRLAALLPSAGRVAPPSQFAALVERIDAYIRSQPETPYRPAVLAARRRAEAGLRGEVPPPADAPDPPSPPPAVGRPAPDFVTTDLVSGASLRLARCRGRPAVLLFVRPDSPAASATLNLAAAVQARYGERVRVAVLVVADEDHARPAWAAAGVPLFAGRQAAVVYAVGGPSRAMVVDADGVVRHLSDGGTGVVEAVQKLVASSGGH